MSLGPERTPVVYPVFAWLEIAERLTTVGDGAHAAAITAAMNGRRRWLRSSYRLRREAA